MRLFYPDRLCLLLELAKAKKVGRAGGLEVQEHEVVRSLASLGLSLQKCAVLCEC